MHDHDDRNDGSLTLVVGATGDLGGRVVRELVARGKRTLARGN
jgi:hypothetical protein